MTRLVILFPLVFQPFSLTWADTIWLEDFSNDEGVGAVGPIPEIISPSSGKWSVDVSAASLTATTDWFRVQNGFFEARDVDGECTWSSQSIDISGYNDITITVSVTESGDHESTDYIKLYYKLDGSSEAIFSTNGDNSDDFTSVTASHSGLNGSSLVILVKVKNNAGTEYLRFDNVMIYGTPVGGNTTVQFLSSSASVSEGAGTNDITVSITNEDAYSSTTVNVVLTTNGTATNGTDISVYATQTVTFAAGNSGHQSVTITVTDDSDFEGDETLVFELQSVSGGNSASIGSPSHFTVTIEDNDAPCIVINEILADPPGGDNGDANGDGTRHTSQDEFVELVNHHGSDINIGGWTLSDNTKVRHTFPNNTVLPNGGAIVVFGGGTPTGSFGNSLLQTASTDNLGLKNGGDDVILRASNGATVASYTYGSEADDDQSITRDPDITGPFVKHSEASDANGALFSPGTKLNGRPFIGVTINESSGGTTVTEGGATDSYTVKLESQPTSDVTITITSDGQITVSPSSLILTSSNYNSGQTITVSAVDDSEIEGNHTSTISHSASSSDGRYNGITIDNMTVIVTDNDEAGITITESGGSTDVTEGGSTDSYTIVLSSAPTTDVIIAISVSNGEVSVDPATQTFTSSNYSTAQIVTVTAVDDNDYEGSHSSTITHTSTSNDVNYNGISIGNVTVSITDNDAPNIVINEIHYNPSGSDDLYEFLELYNSESRSIEISGFSFTNGLSYTFPSNTFIDAGQYIVVAKTSTTYSGGGYKVFQWSGGLTNSGETVEISTASSGGIVVDSVTYGNAPPWPTAANGNGPSLELIHTSLDNSLGASWKASTSFNGTPGTQNSVFDADPAPIIYNISRSVSVPTSLEDVTVTAKVVENSSVKLAQLVYYVNDASETVTNMTRDGTTYTGLIPSNVFGDGHRVKYIIRVTDDASQMSTSDTSAFFAGTTPISSLHPVNVSGELLYSGYYARITGVATVASGVFSTSDLDVYIQDATGGINVYKSGTISTPIIEGNRYTVEGSLGQYRGQTRIVLDDASTDIVDNGAGTPISPTVRTVAQLLSNPELHEGTLIKIENLNKTSTSTGWPESGSSKILQVTDSDGAHSLNMFIDEDTNVDEGPEPTYPMDVGGILSQSDPSSPYNSSYRIMPRAYSDISGNQSPTSVGFATTSATVTEDGTSTTLTVSISNPSSVLETSIDIVLKSGDASDIGNYVTQTVTFPTGSSVKQTISIAITDNSEYEGNRTMQFVLRNLSGEYGATIDVDSIFTLSIQEDDPQPKTVVQFTSLAATVNEGDGTTTLLLSIIAPSSSESTLVEIVLTGGTGDSTDIGNYSSQSVAFPPGSSDNQSVLLTLTDDPYYEGDEILVFTLRNITGGHSSIIGNDSTFTLTIEENDLQTSLQFSTIRTTLVEGMDNTIALTVAITNPFDLAVTTVDVVLISGNPKDVGNYTTQTLIFPLGSSDNQFVTLTITDDDIVEQNDTLVFDLQNTSSGNATTVGMNSQFTLIIQDRDIYSIIINEIHYNPSSAQGSDDDYEFMELYNAGTATAYLGGYSFTHGIEYVFTMADSIQAGGYFVLAKNAVTYPGSIQWTSNGLRNSGENIVIVNQAGFIVDSVSYDDTAPWPTEPNGGGPSLELIHPSLDNAVAENWQASFLEGGTSGKGNSSNSTPLVTADTYVMDEDDTLTVAVPGVLTNDTDADDHTLKAKLNSDVSRGTLSLSADGSFTYIPNANDNGTDSFTYVANDSWVDSDPATVTITISPVNDTPELLTPLQDVTVSEDDPETVIELTEIFTDVDVLTNNDQQLYSIDHENQALLTATIEDSTLTLDYLENQFGTDKVIITATDLSEASVVDSFLVTVSAVNDPPVISSAMPVYYFIKVGSIDTLDFRSYASDVDDSVSKLTWSLILIDSDADSDETLWNGTITEIEEGVLLFDPQNNSFVGKIKITAMLTDNVDSTSLTGIIVEWMPNTPPTIHLLTLDYTLLEDTPLMIVLTDTNKLDSEDPDSFLVWSVSGFDDYGSVISVNHQATNDTITFTPNANFNGLVDSVKLRLTDTQGAHAEKLLSIRWTPVNDPPVVANPIADITVDEDTDNSLIDLTRVFADIDISTNGDKLTFGFNNGNPGLLDVSLDTMTLSLACLQDQHGEVTITVTAIDDSSASITDTFKVVVNPVNDTPVFTSTPDTSVLEDSLYGYTITVSDIDGDSLYFGIADTLPGWLTFNVAKGLLSGTPKNENVGSYPISLTVTDSVITTPVLQFFILEVINVDDPPAVVHPFPDINVNEDAPDTIMGSLRNVFEDVDDTLNFNHTNSNTGLVQVSINNDVVTLHFLSDANGTAELVFKASNIGSPVSVKDTVLIVVNPLNDAPSIAHVLPDVSINEDIFSAIIISKLEDFFNDVDEGDLLILTGEALDEGLDSLNIRHINEGDYIGLGVKGDQRNTAIDNPMIQKTHGLLSTHSMIHPRTAKTLNVHLNSNTPSNRFFDTISSNASLGITTDSTALIVYPKMNFNGKVRIMITAVDDSSASVNDTLELTIMPLNDPPVLTEIPGISINEDDTLALMLSAYDKDGDTLTFSASSDTSAVLAVVTDTILTLIPNKNWYGDGNITITVTDQQVNVSDEFVLMVLPVNDVPAAFNLLEPADNAVIMITHDNLADTMCVSWEKATDVDGDKVLYSAKWSGELSILAIDETADTTISLDYAGLAALIHGQELAIITGSWTIIASDGKLTTEANNGPFTLTIDAGGLGVGEVQLIPHVFALHQNHPNPFNPVTSIRYDIPKVVNVRIEIYNLLGQKVRILVASRYQPGFYHTVWNGRNDNGVFVTTGVYIYRILATDPASGMTSFTKTQKLVLIK